MLYLPAEFPLDPQLCYLNHAAIGPWPRRTAQTVANFAQQNMMRGGADYPDWLQVEQRLRARIARMINAPSSDDVALMKNTSEGLSTISQGLDWRDGDEVVGLAHDFCSNQMPWQVLDSRGVRYRPIDALRSEDPEQTLIKAISPETRLLAISTVHYATGYRFDLERLAAACRQHGVLLSVDVIQSLGALPFDLQVVDADFVTCGGHKWLLAPEGLGFFYCRASLRGRLGLHQFGWAMREHPYDFEGDDWQPAQSARRFESGTPNMMGIHALDASLGLLEEVGSDQIVQRLETNVDILIEGLKALPGVTIVTPEANAKRAGIVTFRHSTAPQETLHRQLVADGVICAARAGGIRLAPHFYTPESALNRAIEKISQLI